MFSSRAENLVASDDNEETDVFRYELATGEIVLVSVGQGGEQGDESALKPSISGDGNLISFESDGNSLAEEGAPYDDQLYVKNVATGELKIATRETDGSFLGEIGGNLDALLSADGTVVAFSTHEEGRSVYETLYLKNLETDELTVIPLPWDTGLLWNMDISDDGSRVLLDDRINQVLYEYSGGTMTRFSPNYPPEILSEGTADGVYIEGGARFIASVAGIGYSSGECPDSLYVSEGSPGTVTMIPYTFRAASGVVSGDGSKLVFGAQHEGGSNWFLHLVNMP